MNQPSSAADTGIHRLLAHMVKVDASDLYLTAGSPPVFRIAGVGHAARVPLTAEHVGVMAASVMTEAQRLEFDSSLEMNLALSLGDVGRFRVNVFRQRGATGMVVRLVRTRITTLDELGHPAVLKEVAMSRRGLVLLVGATGSGKSTTLAAMIDHRNATETGHIVTVEDPVEFIHPHKMCLVTQREIGFDTHSYADALRNTLRQAPDVILIGEIRDLETMEAAISFAETGHLCLSTLHANNANQAIERILNFFPPSRLTEIRLQLSLNLRALISQRLLPAHQGGRAAALEILLDTPRIRDLVKHGEIEALKDAMEQAAGEGCRTFDMALYEMVAAGRVSEAEALRSADSPNNLRLRLERLQAAGHGEAADDEPPLRLVPEPDSKAQGGAWGTPGPGGATPLARVARPVPAPQKAASPFGPPRSGLATGGG
jgi:twitching motility protein PilU